MGWSENDVENLLRHLSDMDSNNFPGKHGAGVFFMGYQATSTYIFDSFLVSAFKELIYQSMKDILIHSLKGI